MKVFGKVNNDFKMFEEGDYNKDDIEKILMELKIGMRMGMEDGVMGFIVGIDMDMKIGGEYNDEKMKKIWFMNQFKFDELKMYVKVEIVVKM